MIKKLFLLLFSISTLHSLYSVGVTVYNHTPYKIAFSYDYITGLWPDTKTQWKTIIIPKWDFESSKIGECHTTYRLVTELPGKKKGDPNTEVARAIYNGINNVNVWVTHHGEDNYTIEYSEIPTYCGGPS